VKPLACIRNEAEDAMGVAPDAFEESGMQVRVVEAWDDEPLPDLAGVAALAAFGGSMNVDDTGSFPYLERERRLLREAVDEGVPVLGICLGAQLVARGLGQPVFRLPSRRLAFGDVTLTEAGRNDPLMPAFAPGSAFHWNEDAFDAPPGAELLATGPEEQLEAFRVGQVAWGLVFHPEVTEGELKVWMDLTEGLEGKWGRSREDVEAEITERLPEHHERGRRFLEAFGSFVRGRSA
jgi:GMP synthase (glutamine-hydrolysing)